MNQNANDQPIIISLLKPNMPPASNEDPVFSKEQEEALEKYLLSFYTTAALGIDGEGVRKLAYEIAVLNNLKVPDSWILAGMATDEWLTGYQFRRHLAHVMHH